MDQIRACEAASVPHMGEDDRRAYMENLREQLTGRKGQEASRPTAAQEAEWKKNREMLACIFGRKGQ